MVKSIKGILFATVLGASVIVAAPGDLDTTFGIGGKVDIDFTGHSTAIQSDGKIVVGGYVYPPTAFALARYNTDGSLDASFGSGGKVVTDFPGGSSRVFSIAIQSDGKILAAGSSHNYNSSVGYYLSDFALARYNTDGSLDTSFGSGGKVETDFFGETDYAKTVTIQSDGKIVLGGTAWGGRNYRSDFALARYNTDGSLDTSFSGDGKVVTEFFGWVDIVTSVTTQSDGKILAAGVTHNLNSGFYSSDFALVRYSINGSLDTSFGSFGKVVTDFFGEWDGGESVAIQSDGKIVVAGTASDDKNGDFAIVRYNIDGSFDTNFGSGGKVTTDFFGSFDIGNDISIQSNGKIIVTGRADNDPSLLTDISLARYNTNGSLDTVFGIGGKVVLDTSSYEGQSVSIQDDGKIVVMGTSELARLEGDPTLVPDIDVAPASMDFSDVIIGNTSEESVTVSNTGTGELAISGISLLGLDASEFSQTNNCVIVVPGSSCTVTVTFTPVDEGSKTATLSITSDDPDEETVNVSLAANAKTPQEFADDIVAFMDASALSGELAGTGRGNSATKRLNALRNMIIMAKALIDQGDIPAACVQLQDAYEKTDGNTTPPDLVSGDAAEELAGMIQELMSSLGCS